MESLFSNIEQETHTTVLIIGSTGTGKSKLAIDLSCRLPFFEVVNADALQLYQGLDLITNKVTEEECRGIRHHMLNVLPPSANNFTAHDYCNRTAQVLKDIWSRGFTPIIVGGTHYYIEKLIWPSDFIDDFYDKEFDLLDDTDHTFTLGNEELHLMLQQLDPAVSSRIHPCDRRRVLKNLRRLQKSQNCRDREPSSCCSRSESTALFTSKVHDVLIFWVQCDKSTLYSRLDARVDDMLSKGLKNEICEFFDTHPEAQCLLKNPANEVDAGFRGLYQAIGLKEFLPFLALPPADRGSLVAQELFESCVLKLKTATRQYARKQIRWIQNRFLGMRRSSSVRVYALDSSNLAAWEENVVAPAVSIVRAYLNHECVEDIPCLPTAFEDEQLRRGELFSCDDCGIMAKGSQQFNEHLNSRRHKKRVASLKSRDKFRAAQSQALL